MKASSNYILQIESKFKNEMQEEIKSIQSTTQKQQSVNGQVQMQKYKQMNKTYDDCDSQKGIISVLMKFVPITIYLVLKLITDEHLSLFIVITLLMAIDFWTTKNILGPKLVGLKWFSAVDQEENEKWCFVSCSETRVISKVNSVFFWVPQIVALLFWIVIIFLNMITLGLFWVALAMYAAFILVINLVFFMQCNGDHQQKVNFIAKKFGFQPYKKQQKQKDQFGSFHQ